MKNALCLSPCIPLYIGCFMSRCTVGNQKLKIVARHRGIHPNVIVTTLGHGTSAVASLQWTQTSHVLYSKFSGLYDIQGVWPNVPRSYF